jgi:hypothetical protein
MSQLGIRVKLACHRHILFKKILRNRLRTVFVIPRKKVLIPTIYFFKFAAAAFYYELQLLPKVAVNI